MNSRSSELLQLSRLSIAFRGTAGLRTIVDNIEMEIRKGEIMALVGESGSGKTLLARAIVGLLPPGGVVTSGTIRYRARELSITDHHDFHSIRGRDISFVFQEPLSSLNPALRVGLQLTEGLKYHRRLEHSECRSRALQMLQRVKISEPHRVMDMYPHELSGGMRQRVMIATALILKPALIIADEPTTALDMIVQEEVLVLLKEVAEEMNSAILLITHDLSAVAYLAQSVNVMHQGQIVECGSVKQILQQPKNGYTKKLLAATPQARPTTAITMGQGVNTLGTRPAMPILQVRDLSVAFPGKRTGLGRQEPVTFVLDNVSFAVAEGETLAIIGESGSGKTTLSRSIIGLQPASSGEILFRGKPVSGLDRGLERKMQFIFQDPFSSLDPRMRIAGIITEGLRFTTKLNTAGRRLKAINALREVELDEDLIDRFPHQLSGGQRQRVSIARAIIMQPDFIIADEPVSALDLTVQKQIMELLLDLKKRIGFACLFVSHDLGVVERFADRVGVLFRGRLVEIGSRDDVFNRPSHPYTQKLLCATPRLVRQTDAGYRLSRRKFAPIELPLGATFYEPTADQASFQYQELGTGHFAAVSGDPEPLDQ